MLMIFGLLLLLVIVYTYPKWSYREFDKRSYINSKYSKWTKYCGRNFLKEDPQWFIDNGYGEYIE